MRVSILQHLSEQLDRFILEYLRVNEDACDQTEVEEQGVTSLCKAPFISEFDTSARKGTPRWVRLPNPTPKTLPCPTCGSNLTKEKETRYDCSWWAGGKKRSKTFDTKHAASRFLASAVTETHGGTYQQTRPISMNAVFDEWEKHLDVKLQQGRLKPSTMKAYQCMVRKHLRPAFGACRSDKLTVNVVLEWERRYATLLATGDLTAKYYNNLLGTLRVVLSWARGRGQRYLTHNPLEELKPAYVPKTEARFLERAELGALLDAADNLRDQTILYTRRLLGPPSR